MSEAGLKLASELTAKDERIEELERKVENYKKHLARADDYIDELQRQLAERRTVTDDMKREAIKVAKRCGISHCTGDDFDAIVGLMLSAALEAGDVGSV